MSSTDVSPVVDRIASQIASLSKIGLVHKFDPWDRDDLRDTLVSEIDGEKKLRVWWISGPALGPSEKVEQRAAGYEQRTWVYTIHGIEGLSETGDDIITLRANALAIADKLDADFTLGNTCHRTWPATWPVRPEHRTLVTFAVSYVEIEKRVLTLSTP